MAGGYAFQPQGIEGMRAEFLKLQNQIDALRKSLTGLGIQIDPNGNLIFDGSRGALDITNGGALNVDGSATIGGTLNVTGSTVIGGTLSLPAGIIDNAALANPTAFGNYSGDTNSTTLTVAGSDIHTGTITVPAGFTKAQVICMVSVGNGRNAGAGGAPFYAEAWIGGTGGRNGPVIGITCAENSSADLTTMTSAIVTGLSGGGTVTFGAFAQVDALAGWSAGEANGHVTATATFLR